MSEQGTSPSAGAKPRFAVWIKQRGGVYALENPAMDTFDTRQEADCYVASLAVNGVSAYIREA